MAQFGPECHGDARRIPFGFAQGKLSLRLKDGCVQDDALTKVLVGTQTAPLPLSSLRSRLS